MRQKKKEPSQKLMIRIKETNYETQHSEETMTIDDLRMM